jgi:hypothetical protein
VQDHRHAGDDFVAGEGREHEDVERNDSGHRVNPRLPCV